MTIEMYGYTSCSSCRKTDEALKQSGKEYVYRDYFRQRFSHDELVGVFDRAGLTARQVLSTRSKVYQARAAEIDALDDDALLMLMLDEPTLLRRPIVIGGGDVVIGHNATKLATLVDQAK
jgi:Spx/MgsR family transcriptional regulator